MWTRIIGVLQAKWNCLTGADKEEAFEQSYQASVSEAIANSLPIPPRPRDLPFSRRTCANQALPVLATGCRQDDRNIYWLSSRIWYGRTTADLQAMGIELTGKSEGNCIEAVLPAGWSVVGTDVSPYQKRLLDSAGAIRARLYYQPGSAGGNMEMCLEQDIQACRRPN